MRYLAFRVAGFLTLAGAAAACLAPPALGQNVPTFSKQVVASRVWTNDDMDQLRNEGLISTFSAAPGATANQPAQQAQASPPALTPRPVRVEDPDWYAEQAARLQAELDSRQSALQQYVRAIADARSRTNMTGGIALDKDSIGVTPEAGIQILQAQVNETQSQLDDLAELARENGIPPGVLRG
jgi:hypothetical protein